MRDAAIADNLKTDAAEEISPDESGDAAQSSIRPQGEYVRADGKRVIGRVGAPAGQTATSEEFFFTFPADVLVEKTQIVTCESRIADKVYTFYALVTEVFRQSRQRAMSGEADEYDGDLSFRPPLESAGFNTASASILRVDWGMATGMWSAGMQPSSVRITLKSDGTAHVASATSDIGPGTYTVMTMIAAEYLGLPAEKIKTEIGDTRFPRGPVQGGSMTAASIGTAIYGSANSIKGKLLD